MTTATTTQKTGMALDDWMASEGIELWDGEVIEMSPQAARSTRIETRILQKLLLYLVQNPIGEAHGQPSCYIPDDNNPQWVRNSLTPDIGFFPQAALDTLTEQDPQWDQKGFPLMPALAVEIVSPTDAFSDVTRKAETYLRLGVGVVWIIEPETQQVLIYDAAHGNTILTAKDTLQAEALLPGFALPIAELLQGGQS